MKTILIAEDNQINRIVISSYLKKRGYEFFCVNNGEEALKAYGESEFALILMDIQMPRIDGIEVAKIIRKLEREDKKTETPIIAMTAYTMANDREECYKAGMNDFIGKPIDVNELYKLLDKYLS